MTTAYCGKYKQVKKERKLLLVLSQEADVTNPLVCRAGLFSPLLHFSLSSQKVWDHTMHIGFTLVVSDLNLLEKINVGLPNTYFHIFLIYMAVVKFY